MFDYDNDGWPDIFLVNGTTLEGFPPDKAPTNHLYHNNQDGTFTDVTAKAGLAASGWGQGACVGDYDNDGWEDLYVTYYGKNRLYHNDHGVFTEVAEQAGVAGSGKTWGTGCAFVDYNRDGQLDIAVASYVNFVLEATPKPGEGICTWKGVPVSREAHWCPGIPTSSTRISATENSQTLAAKLISTAPTENIVLASPPPVRGRRRLFISRVTARRASCITTIATVLSPILLAWLAPRSADGLRHQRAGMGSTIADYNGDGRPDIFKTNFSDDTPTLYRNDGNGAFTDVTFETGLGKHMQYLGWGTMFFDFDNDGWPDIIHSHRHVYPEVDKFHLGLDYKESRLLYHNGNGTFTDITPDAGPGITAQSSSRGLALGDLWNDGRISLVINNMNAAPSLLVNDAKSGNRR